MRKKILQVALVVLTAWSLNGCQDQSSDQNTVRVGTISGPETQLMQVAKQVAMKRYGLDVKIVTFSDYVVPNAALASGGIDANAFQHRPFLESQMRAHNYNLVVVGKTFLYPMGLYSRKIKSLADLPDGAKVVVPNDPSNEARALLLLQNAKLIRLKEGAGINATIDDIVDNPKKLRFVELDAAELPRALGEVTLAAINTNYAKLINLSPEKDALFAENPKDSPYTNVIVARADDANLKKIQELVLSFQSQPVVDRATQLFGSGAIAGFVVTKESSKKEPVPTQEGSVQTQPRT